MRKLCIVHFHELEKFPPAVNLIRSLRMYGALDNQIYVLTTSSPDHPIIEIEGVHILRLVKWKREMNRIVRMWRYFQFNISAFAKLVRIKPSAILYYETLSAGPPIWYKKYINSSVEIYVHYHEYISLQEYEEGMVLNRWLHHLELKWYPKTRWLSQTNQDRIRLFLKDVNNHAPGNTQVLPNYPPGNWKRRPAAGTTGKIRFVYVGAISMSTMYIREMVEFLCTHKGKCSWDIYSSNVSSDALRYIESSGCKEIAFKGGVPYDILPDVLPNYDVGLVLYKGHIPNYVFNIPNKLFEYHVCGLDVWFPVTMTSSHRLQTDGTYPKIIAVDFEQLHAIDPDAITNHDGLKEQQQSFDCENIYRTLAEGLIHGNIK